MEQHINWWLTAVTIGLVPTLIWAWRVHATVKDTHKMHLNPDKYGFGTAKTNAMLAQHMTDELDMLNESLIVTRDVKHAIKELSHYARWAAKQQTGKEPPPYVRNGD